MDGIEIAIYLIPLTILGCILYFVVSYVAMGIVNLLMRLMEYASYPFTWLYRMLRKTSAGTWMDIFVLLFVFLLTAGLVCCFIYPGWLNT